MRFRWLLAALSFGSVCSGCSLFVTAARDICYEVKLEIEECFEKQRNAAAAREAWAHCAARPKVSHHYACGYKDGFADYLHAGPRPEPPALPPHHYWWFGFQTAEGHAAIEEWYAGFRDGAAAAEASGLRGLVVVPTQSNLPPAVPPPLPPPPGIVPHDAGAAHEPLRSPRELPVP